MDAFFDELRRTPRKWRVAKGCIRLTVEPSCRPACPIDAVYLARIRKGLVSGKDVILSGSTVGLTGDEGMAIAQAADCWPGYDVALRRRLLEACGLEAEQSA